MVGCCSSSLENLELYQQELERGREREREKRKHLRDATCSLRCPQLLTFAVGLRNRVNKGRQEEDRLAFCLSLSRFHWQRGFSSEVMVSTAFAPADERNDCSRERFIVTFLFLSYYVGRLSPSLSVSLQPTRSVNPA